MVPVRDVAVLVRYFMSAAVSIPPTITIRADSITPTTGGDRTDLRPHGVPANINRRWRAFPAQATPFSLSITRPTHHVRLVRQAQATKARSRLTQPIARQRTSQ